MALPDSNISDISITTHAIKRIVAGFCELVERVIYFPGNNGLESLDAL